MCAFCALRSVSSVRLVVGVGLRVVVVLLCVCVWLVCVMCVGEVCVCVYVYVYVCVCVCVLVYVFVRCEVWRWEEGGGEDGGPQWQPRFAACDVASLSQCGWEAWLAPPHFTNER